MSKNIKILSANSKHLDFTPAVQSVSLKNTSNDQLFVHIELLGDDAFQLTSPAKVKLEKQATGKVNVEFRPNTKGRLFTRAAKFKAHVEVWVVDAKAGHRELVDTVNLTGTAPGYVEKIDCLRDTTLQKKGKAKGHYG